MNSRKVDLRVKYTKTLLKKSLVELMRKHHISKISVKLLCEAADINRSTFYAHYADQYDLLKQLEQEVIEELEKHIHDNYFSEQASQTEQPLNQIMAYIAKNADLFKILLSENVDSTFQKEIMILVQQQIILALRNDRSIDSRTSEYMQYFVATGSLSILQKWLQDGMAESIEQMSELISKLLNKGLSAFIPSTTF